MISSFVYHPVWFYLVIMFAAMVLCPVGIYLSNQHGLEKLQLPFLLFGLSVPCITALVMIYSSSDGILVADFWRRLMLFKISAPYMLFIVFLMPCVICLATSISLFFGYSSEQFLMTQGMSAMKGWAILGIAIPLLLAPLIEELGWRGYGVDSLGAYYNLFKTSMLFGFLWAVWHLPTFFIKGYYQNDLWNMGIVYVINFFVSVFVIAILMNWVYYKTDRSIPAIVLFHAVLNFSSMFLRTQQFTKCIATTILCVIAIIVITCDRDYFFNNSLFELK